MPQFSVPEGPVPPPVDPEAFLRNLARLREGIPPDRDFLEALQRDLIQTPPLGGTSGTGGGRPPDVAGDGEQFDEIETLGRDFGYDTDDWSQQQEGQVQVSSTNVYSYFYQQESNYSGILYVTFLAPAPKGQPRTEPGATYAYYDVSRGKYERFKREADGSAGSAVWDQLRVRGTLWEHQHRYRLVNVAGEYVPRRATARGFRTRQLRPIGRPSQQERGPLPRDPSARARELQRRGFRRSTLPEQLFSPDPDRGDPNRGEPDRGR